MKRIWIDSFDINLKSDSESQIRNSTGTKLLRLGAGQIVELGQREPEGNLASAGTRAHERAS